MHSIQCVSLLLTRRKEFKNEIPILLSIRAATIAPHPLGQPGFGFHRFCGQAQAPRQPFQVRTDEPVNSLVAMQGGPAPQGTSKMEAYMQTANRFLNTAQQFAPVVQQFAPMMQNLPAMWKLYKGFQSLPSAGSGAAGAAAASGSLLRCRTIRSTKCQPGFIYSTNFSTSRLLTLNRQARLRYNRM